MCVSHMPQLLESNQIEILLVLIVVTACCVSGLSVLVIDPACREMNDSIQRADSNVSINTCDEVLLHALDRKAFAPFTNLTIFKVFFLVLVHVLASAVFCCS